MAPIRRETAVGSARSRVRCMKRPDEDDWPQGGEVDYTRHLRLFGRGTVDYHVHFDRVRYVVKARKGRTVVFDGMSAYVPKGRRVAILGARRSGKTSLVKLIAGVAVPAAGEVRLNSRISWPVGGSYLVAPALSVRDNVVFCANLLGVGARAMLRYVDDICMFGPKMHEVVRNLPKVYRTRLNYALPLVANFDCFLVDGGLSLDRMRLPDDRVEWMRSQFLAKDMIVVTGKARTAREWCDTGAAILDRHLVFCQSVEEAIGLVGDLEPDDERHTPDEDDEEEEVDNNGFW